MKYIFVLILLLLTIVNLEAKNPIESPTFNDIIEDTIGKDKYIFDDINIKIKVPTFADNPVQVPFFVDGSKIKDAKKMIIFADLNPIALIVSMKTKEFLPIISTNIKVAQETPLRALILDKNNLWHIGSANIKSNGGGCDISSQASSNSNFSDNLGKSKGKVFDKKRKRRINFSIFHPMETGLIFGSVPFYIKDIKIKDEKNNLLTSIKTTSALSENPRITLETKNSFKKINITFIDNDANIFKLDLP